MCPQTTSDLWPLPGPRPPHPGGRHRTVISWDSSVTQASGSVSNWILMCLRAKWAGSLEFAGNWVRGGTQYCLLFLTWRLLRWHLNAHRVHLNGFLWHLHNSNNNQLKDFPYRDASLSFQTCVLVFSFVCFTENPQIYSVIINCTLTLTEALFFLFLSLCRQIQNFFL